jgi:hypothetical protein
MTVRELFREFAADRMRARDYHDRDVTLAWQAVRIYGLALAGKMPDLKSLMSDAAPAQTIQTYEEQLEALKMLSGMYGGKLITVVRPKKGAA